MLSDAIARAWNWVRSGGRGVTYRDLLDLDQYLDNMAEQAFLTRDFETAGTCWEAVFAIRLLPGRRTIPVSLPRVLDMLGSIERDDQRPDRAQSRYELAGAVLEQIDPGGRDLTINLGFRAAMHWLLGETAAADLLSARAEKIWEVLAPGGVDHALCLQDRQRACLDRGDLAGALANQRRAHAILTAQAWGTHEHEKSLSSLIDVLARIPSEARAELADVLAEVDRLRVGGIVRAEAFLLAVRVHLLDGDEERAGRALQRAMEAHPSAGVLVEAGIAALDAGRAARNTATIDSGRKLLQTVLLAQPGSADAITAATAIAAEDSRNGDLDAALRLLDQATEAIERLRGVAPGPIGLALFERYQNAYREAIALSATRGGIPAGTGFALAERMRSRDLAERVSVVASDQREQSERERLRERERDLEREIRQRQQELVAHIRQGQAAEPGSASNTADFVDRMLSVPDLETELVRVRTQLRSVSEPPLDLPAVQRRLRTGELLLNYVLAAGQLHLWMMERDRATHQRIDVDNEHLIADLAAALPAGATPIARDLAAESHIGAADRGPALDRLAVALLGAAPAECWQRADSILIVADGPLHWLPFERLPMPSRAGTQLVDVAPVTYLPSASLGLRLREGWRPRRRWTHDYLGIGDPAYTRSTGSDPHRVAASWSLEPLHGSGEEVREIAKLFAPSAMTWTGPEATEWRVRQAIPQARYVSLATHGLVVDTDPRLSGLAWAPPTTAELALDPYLDDLLQVREIEQLRLSAELVVCSACRTGAGVLRGGEGVIGMARAFLAAGARQVLVSLWPVPDDPTARFMRSFFEAVQAGEPVARALRKARLRSRERGDGEGVWGAFICVGAAP
jgi:tetratricopeptide (TPR) repeat protein